MAQERKVGALEVMAMLSLPLVSMGFSVVTPAMATLAEHFVGKDVSWISTLPTLFVVIGTMIAGSIMGKKVKYRTLAIVASFLYLVGGCAPALFDNYMMTLVCRAILGFGLGLLSPLGNALIIGLYKGQKQAAMLGYGTLCMNAGGIVLQMLGGALAGISWQMTFWGHAFSLIALVLAFFLPEPNLPEPSAHETSGTQKKEKMGSVVWILSSIFLCFNVLNYPIMMNVSVLFEMRDAGGPAAAATALSLYTVAGCLAGLVFGKLFQHAQRWCFTLGFALCGTGALLVYLCTINILMTLGLMMLGFGFSIIMPTGMAWLGIGTPPSTVALGTSIVMALMNLGAFASSIWLKILNAIFGETIFSAIMTEIIVFFAAAAVFVICNPFKQKK